MLICCAVWPLPLHFSNYNRLISTLSEWRQCACEVSREQPWLKPSPCDPLYNPCSTDRYHETRVIVTVYTHTHKNNKMGVIKVKYTQAHARINPNTPSHRETQRERLNIARKLWDSTDHEFVKTPQTHAQADIENRILRQIALATFIMTNKYRVFHFLFMFL